jgi:putative transposase
MDLSRGKAELLAENALLRQHLIVLRRQIIRPGCNTTHQLLLVLLARALRTCRQAVYLVQPETRLAHASPSISCMVEAHVQSNVYNTKDLS